ARPRAGCVARDPPAVPVCLRPPPRLARARGAHGHDHPATRVGRGLGYSAVGPLLRRSLRQLRAPVDLDVVDLPLREGPEVTAVVAVAARPAMQADGPPGGGVDAELESHRV